MRLKWEIGFGEIFSGVRRVVVRHVVVRRVVFYPLIPGKRHGVARFRGPGLVDVLLTLYLDEADPMAQQLRRDVDGAGYVQAQP